MHVFAGAVAASNRDRLSLHAITPPGTDLATALRNAPANLAATYAALAELRQVWPNAYVSASSDILPEIRERLRFLVEVGLGYLQMGRGVTTLNNALLLRTLP